MKKILYKIANYFLNKRWIMNLILPFLSKEKQEKIMIARLRQEFIFFGMDMSDLTDEEIKQGVSNIAKVISSFGSTADEAAKAFQVLVYPIDETLSECCGAQIKNDDGYKYCANCLWKTKQKGK